MARKLKVFSVNVDGRNAAITAATSKKAALKAILDAGYNMSMYYFNEMASETGNALDVQVAMSEPGEVFVAPMTYYATDTSHYTKREKRK